MPNYIRKSELIVAFQWNNQDYNDMPHWLQDKFDDNTLRIINADSKYCSIDGRYLQLNENSSNIFIVESDDIYDYEGETQYCKCWCKVGDYLVYKNNDIAFYDKIQFENTYELAIGC